MTDDDFDRFLSEISDEQERIEQVGEAIRKRLAAMFDNLFDGEPTSPTEGKEHDSAS